MSWSPVRRSLRPARLVRLAQALVLVTTVVLGSVPPPGAQPALPPGRFVGLVGAPVGGAQAAVAAGVSAVTLQVGWDRAQPRRGELLDLSYTEELRGHMRQYADLGVDVVLDPGLQYPPAWVFETPGARFVNQFGDEFSAPQESGENVPDAVHDLRVRAAQADYLRRLARSLGPRSFSAVRAGGLLTGELRYPGAAVGGRTNAIWAYSSSALASDGTGGYRPGISPRSVWAERELARDYLDDMADYQGFLARTLRSAFPAADVLLMYPSYGIRPGDVAAAIQRGLAIEGTRSSEISQGVDFARLVRRIPSYPGSGYGGRYIAYSTWIDGPSSGTSAVHSSPIAYLAAVAGRMGVPVAGENTALSARSPEAMRLTARRAAELKLVGVFWFDATAVLDQPTGMTGMREIREAVVR